MERDVGFVGLGAMGSRMARNLVAAGFLLRVYDANPEALSRFANEGVIVAQNVREIVENCNWIILSLPDGEVVESVLYDEDGLRSRLRRGQVVIDCSTIPPEQAARVAEDFCSVDARFLDAPVTGMEARADHGWRGRGRFQ